jgi:quercetin dioxygenase-like cupin family protein
VRLSCHLRPLGALVGVALLSSCHPASTQAGATRVSSPPAGVAQPLLLQESEGERRVHRPPPATLSNLAAPFIIKLDRRNGGAPEFVMLMEDIAPGQGIPPHMHPNSDEILFIRDGSGTAVLGGKEATVLAGATIYMPRNTSVRLKNTGTQPLRIIAIFSQPGYESYMRDISVPEGEVATPLTIDELTDIRARHHAEVVYAQP